MTWKPIETAAEDTIFWAAEFRKGELYGHIFITHLLDGELHWQIPMFACDKDPNEIKFRRKNGRFNPTHWRELAEEWVLLEPENPEKFSWNGPL